MLLDPPFIHSISELFGVIIAGIGILRGIPWAYRHGRVMAENKSLREENERLRDGLDGAIKTINAWELRADQLEGSIRQLQLELAESVIYIVDLVNHLHTGGLSKPPVPEVLRDLISRATDRSGEPATS